MTLPRVFQQLLLAAAAVFSAFFSMCAHAQDRQAEYRLGSGDSIRIVVFQNPDLTLETRVTENGTISYPLIGQVKVGGLTIPEAEQAIAKPLSDGGFMQRPQVSIALLQNRGNQVSVLGAVNRAGRFPLETFNTRVSEMIAIAGGIAATGADVAIVTGVRDGKPLRREIDIPGMVLDDRLQENIVVAGGDVIYVHRMPMFYVYGQAQKPGSFRVERGMTIRQALAQAGGIAPRGTERRLRLYRLGAGGRTEMLSPELDDPVLANDVLYVNDSLF